MYPFIPENTGINSFRTIPQDDDYFKVCCEFINYVFKTNNPNMIPYSQYPIFSVTLSENVEKSGLFDMIPYSNLLKRRRFIFTDASNIFQLYQELGEKNYNVLGNGDFCGDFPTHVSQNVFSFVCQTQSNNLLFTHTMTISINPATGPSVLTHQIHIHS